MKDNESFSSQVEVLTVREFSSRMKIGKSTVYNWIRDGILVEGVHYFKTKDKRQRIRIPWSQELISNFLGEPPPLPHKSQTGDSESRINLDF